MFTLLVIKFDFWSYFILFVCLICSNMDAPYYIKRYIIYNHAWFLGQHLPLGQMILYSVPCKTTSYPPVIHVIVLFYWLSWYVGKMSASDIDCVISELTDAVDGMFLVRESITHPGYYFLYVWWVNTMVSWHEYLECFT